MTERTRVPATGGWKAFEPVAPIVVFLVLNRLGGLRWAVAGSAVASIKVAIDRKRRNETLGVVLPVLTVAIIVRGVIGIVTDSERVYFGLGIAGKFVIGAVLLGSALVARPLAERGAIKLFAVTDAVRAHAAWKRAMIIATSIAGLYYLCSGALDVFLLQRNSAEGYVLIRFVANWPLSIAAMVVASVLVDRQFRKIPGLAPLSELLEARLSELDNSNPEVAENP